MKPYDLLSFNTPNALAHAAATAWLREVETSARSGTRFAAAISGGRIAGTFFSALREMAASRPNCLGAVDFFWADERCVPPADPESNYQLADKLLLTPLKIEASRIHRIQGEAPPSQAAASASAALRAVAVPNGHNAPVLDLILLGLGEDGHIASLFPGQTDGGAGGTSIYRAVANSPKPPPNRITMDYPVLAAARQVWMLASGAGKETALRDSLSPAGTTPFARLLRNRSNTRIFTDIGGL